MFCGKCGTENSDGAKFCKKCGQPLDTRVNEFRNNTEGSFNNSPVGNGMNQGVGQNGNLGAQGVTNKIKKIPKSIFIGGGVGVIAIIVIVAFLIINSNTIDLNKYLKIEATGYNGYGKAKVTIDWDAIKQQHGSSISFTGSARQQFGNMLGMTTPFEAFKGMVGVRFDKDSGLSNGDNLTYKWVIDGDMTKYLNCKVKYSDGTYTVSSLNNIETFDAFSNLSVDFSGISPAGKADIKYNGSDFTAYDFKCDKTNGLKNGDTINVTITADMEAYANKNGKIPETTSKEYTVSGLQEYISSFSGIKDDFLASIKKEAEDTIYSYAAGSYNKTMSLSNLEYAGYIMNSLKESGGFSNNYNNLYLIYKGDVSSPEGKFTAAKVYYPVRFSNVLKGEGDKLSYNRNEGIIGTSYFDKGSYSTRGYINPVLCYMDIVEKNSERYSAECGGGFETYSKYEKVEKLSDISDEYKNKLHSDAESQIGEFIKTGYSRDYSVSDLAFVGEYLLTAKTQGNDFKKNNTYILVYSVTVSHSRGRFAPTTVYFPVEYDGLFKLPDGNYMLTTSPGIYGRSYFPGSNYSTRGYVNGTDMYSEVITKNRNNYNYEVSEGLKTFGQ